MGAPSWHCQRALLEAVDLKGPILLLLASSALAAPVGNRRARNLEQQVMRLQDDVRMYRQPDEVAPWVASGTKFRSSLSSG